MAQWYTTVQVLISVNVKEKQPENTKCWEEAAQVKQSYTASEIAQWYSNFGKQQFLAEVDIHLTNNPEIPLLDVHSKERKKNLSLQRRVWER